MILSRHTIRLRNAMASRIETFIRRGSILETHLIGATFINAIDGGAWPTIQKAKPFGDLRVRPARYGGQDIISF